jgi:hypothetical protein
MGSSGLGGDDLVRACFRRNSGDRDGGYIAKPLVRRFRIAPIACNLEIQFHYLTKSASSTLLPPELPLGGGENRFDAWRGGSAEGVCAGKMPTCRHALIITNHLQEFTNCSLSKANKSWKDHVLNIGIYSISRPPIISNSADIAAATAQLRQSRAVISLWVGGAVGGVVTALEW